MKQKNSALVLVGQGNVHGVIQVRKEALEKNPELLEQLRRDAHELYNQVLVIEENCDELDVTQVSQWLRDMNPSDDEEDEGDMPWEEAAKWAISGMLDKLEFRPGSVVVTKEEDGPMGAEYAECTSLEQLISELDEAGENAWSGEVPVDGGGQVFSMSDTIDVNEMLFDRCEEQLKELGWA
jgi:hypothetical protein